ncbi:MAG: hypothetical protein KAR38_10755, partial [Calditrichia bacterium]|nr:hypothetical protein [Calditrichia bacterium]
MKKLIILTLLLTVFYSCKDSVTNIDDPPAKINWVEKTNDDFDGVERGIDAYGAEENSIILEWKASPEKDIHSYLLYASDVDNNGDGEPDNFIQVKTLKTDDAGNTTDFNYNVEDSTYTYFFNLNTLELNAGKDNYFYILAEDKGENISEKSDTVNYHLVNSPDLLEVNYDSDESDYYFTWSWPSYFTENIVIRVESYPYNNNPAYITKIAGADNIIENYYDGP